MNDQGSQRRRPQPQGGLRPAAELDAFGDALNEIDAAQGATTPSPAAVPLTPPAVPPPAYAPVARIAPAGARALTVPQPGPVAPLDTEEASASPDPAADPLAQIQRQTTIQVPVQVEERFGLYRKARALQSRRAPFNGDLISEALNDCDGRFEEIIDERRPRKVPGRRFGQPPASQRIVVSEEPTTQINFRHPRGEYDLVEEIARENGVSVAAFFSAVLDDWLPPLAELEQFKDKTARKTRR